MTKSLSFFLLFLFTGVALAAGLEDPKPITDFFADLAKYFSDIKGASILGIVALTVQLLMQAFRTEIGKLAGVYQLAIVYTLNAVGVLLGSLAAGIPLLEALVSGVFLAALQNSIHQWFQKVNVQIKAGH